MLRQAASEKELVWSNYGNAIIFLNKQNFVIPGSFFSIEVSYERAEIEIWFSPWNSDTARKMTFWFPLFKIAFNHSWVKYASYELHQMKEEDPSFPNMCHLLIIIVIKL